MTIANYSELVTEIGAYLDRDDLEPRIPTFIRLTESRLNRLLDDPDMETSVTLTGDGAALPDDYGAMVSLGTADDNRLTPLSNIEYASILPQSGVSRYYTIQNGAIYYVPGSANPTLVYRRSIPALTEASPTNWLLDRAPDVYLYGCLLQASAFDVDGDQVALWKSAYDEAVGELRMDAQRRKWGAGPIAPRIRRT